MRKKFYNSKVETLPLSDLEKVQLRRLRHIIRYVYRNSRFYREKFNKAGIRPSDIQRLADVTKIPFTTKAEVRDNYPYGMLISPLAELRFANFTSGTSGMPAAMFFTDKDFDILVECFCRAMYSAGTRKGDIVQIAIGALWGPTLLVPTIMKLGALAAFTGAGNTKGQVTRLNNLKTTIIHAVPSYLLHMATIANEIGINSRETSLRLAILGGERLTPLVRQKIEQDWNVTAYDLYGTVEQSTGFSECRERMGHHIHADHFLVEIVDPETGEALEDEGTGEIVITTLTREGMPLVRFRTRDCSHLIRDKCNCGRTHPRIGSIEGRLDDVVKIKGTSVPLCEIEDTVMGITGVNSFQAVINKRGALDMLLLRIESSQPSEELARRIQEEVKAATNITPEVEFVQSGSLSITKHGEYKTKRFIDLR